MHEKYVNWVNEKKNQKIFNEKYDRRKNIIEQLPGTCKAFEYEFAIQDEIKFMRKWAKSIIWLRLHDINHKTYPEHRRFLIILGQFDLLNRSDGVVLQRNITIIA